MRLINTSSLELAEFADTEVPLYAILSHRWGDEEVTLQELQSQSPRAVSKAGYKKILNTCSIAATHGFQYAWVDTCCIDKSSSAELSEAINSMYRRYQDSTVCYAYLGDVAHNPLAVNRKDPFVASPDFKKSSWFSRGWTLQELLAPSTVIFLDEAWEEIGTKSTLCPILSGITGIPETILAGEPPETASIAQRMSWASARRTTRTEDIAYCLMGLFNVNMPMLYGEGEKAFLRLQEEIIRVSDDHTIFAWESSRTGSSNGGLLATSPADFACCRDTVPSDSRSARNTLSRIISTDNKGIHLNIPLVPGPSWDAVHTALLPCSRAASVGRTRLGIPLKALSPSLECFVRAPALPMRELPHDGYPDFRHPPRRICVVRQDPRHGRRSSGKLQVLRAAEAGNLDVVELLLRKGGLGERDGVEARDEGTQRTPLLGAARCGHARVVDLLVRLGANVEAVDGDGCTPLMLAVMGGHVEAVMVLLGLGADTETRIVGGWTPLLWAAQEGYGELVRVLVDGGANVEAVDDGGATPLLWAVTRGHVAAVRTLIESGANLEAGDGSGCTPLLCAAESGLTDILQMLVEAGANLEAFDATGNSALRLASREGHRGVMELLANGTKRR